MCSISERPRQNRPICLLKTSSPILLSGQAEGEIGSVKERGIPVTLPYVPLRAAEQYHLYHSMYTPRAQGKLSTNTTASADSDFPNENAIVPTPHFIVLIKMNTK